MAVRFSDRMDRAYPVIYEDKWLNGYNYSWAATAHRCVQQDQPGDGLFPLRILVWNLNDYDSFGGCSS
jgi:hypothetical protein